MLAHYPDGQQIDRNDRVRYKGTRTGVVLRVKETNGRVRVAWDDVNRTTAVMPDNLVLIERNAERVRNAPAPKRKVVERPNIYATGEVPYCNDRITHVKSGRNAAVSGVYPSESIVLVRWLDDAHRRRQRVPANDFNLIERGGVMKVSQDDKA